MAATAANVAAVVATITAQIPAHATVPAATLNAQVLNLLNGLDTEVVAAAKVVEQQTTKAAVITAVAHH